MFYKQILGGLAVLLTIISYIPYIKDILKGKTRPHAFSWLIWFILTGIGFFIQIEGGAGAGAWFNGVMFFICGFIMVYGFIKGRKEIVIADWVSLILAFIAMYFWLIVKDPMLSITLVIIADALGLIPTIRKSLIHPHSETVETYAINAVRVCFGILALSKFSFLTASYHIYMIIANLLVVGVIIIKRKSLLKKT